jgi:hypothetical protein
MCPTTLKTPSSKNPITINSTTYKIHTPQIPYLAFFIAFTTKARPETTSFTHTSPIPLCPVALKGVESGYRHCFCLLPASLPQHQLLCETYDILGVNILAGSQPFSLLLSDLKAGEDGYEVDDDNFCGVAAGYVVVKGDRKKARDAAFRMVYFLLLGEIAEGDEREVSRAVESVVGLWGIFGGVSHG